MKRIPVLMIALSVLLSVSLTVHAHDVPQERNDCSIALTVRYDGHDVSGGTLTVIRIGYVDEEDGNFFFSQEMTGILLEDISSPAAAGAQKDFYSNHRNSYDFFTQTQPVKDGKATFTGLPTGLYLVVQEEAADGFSELGEFLISVPYMTDGVYQYHVTASIKSELKQEVETAEPEPTQKPDPSLPQTGQLNWPVPLMAAAGIALFIIGWALCFGRRKDPRDAV